MCKSCQRLIDNHKEVIDTIDGTREMINAFVNMIGNQLQQKLVEETRTPLDQRDEDLMKIMMLNFLAGFLATDADPPEGFAEVVAHFYSKGVALGAAYVCVRQADNH